MVDADGGDDQDKPEDLQIFIGHVPTDRPIRIQGVPSLVVGEGFRDRGRNLYPSRDEVADDPTGAVPRYIAVANSEVVEAVEFPGLHGMVDFSRRLNVSQVRLQDCIRHGGQLFDFVFHRTIRDLFRRLASRGRDLRVTIATSSPELAVLPWEIMCDVSPGRLPLFLCYQSRLSLDRSLRVFNRADFRRINLGDSEPGGERPRERGIRILLVTANPPDLSQIDVVTEEKMLRFILQEPPELPGVQLEVLHRASAQTLGAALRRFQPHLVHLACHGDYNEAEDLGFLALTSATDPDRHDPVNSYRFAMLLQESPCLEFVFANTCYGARQSQQGELSAFSGVAQSLHATGVPAVAALQFSLFDRTAHSIVLGFYKYLLRDGLSVEASITRVRRNMFIDGNMFHEAFGLVLYQTNATLAWSRHLAAPRLARSEAKGLVGLGELFDEQTRKFVIERLAIEFEKVRAALHNLESLTTADLLLTVKLFDEANLNLALRVLRQAQHSEVGPSVILKFLSLAKALAQNRLENEAVKTAFILKPKAPAEEYRERFKVKEAEPLVKDLFAISIKEIADLAQRVNGLDRAFMVKIGDGGDLVVCITDLGSGNVKVGQGEFPEVVRPWSLVCHNVRESGCALVLPGDGRIKVIVGGEQATEFERGTWKLAGLKEVRDGFVDVGRRNGLPEDLMLHLAKVALVASDQKQGLSLIVQRDDPLVPGKCKPGFIDLQSGPDEYGLRRPITEIPERSYVSLLKTEGATILSKEGVTLAYRVFLDTLSTTKVVPVPATGSRHLAAQTLSKETDAVAIVISEDGPISVFIDGERVLYYP